MPPAMYPHWGTPQPEPPGLVRRLFRLIGGLMLALADWRRS